MQQQPFNNNQQQPMTNMQPTNMQPTNIMPTQMNRGGHELFDAHQVMSCLIGTLNQFLMFEQHIKDPELIDILNRQKQFITDQYNITVQSFKTGQDPAHPTSSYQMNQSNDYTLGTSPSQPSKPNQDISQLGDKCISSLMMASAKSNASAMTTAAAEMANPVLRRILADSIPNHLEMAYELFLYQNKKGYYQVAQLKDQDAQNMLNSYAPTTGVPNMNSQGNMLQ